ncbi:MAG: adenylate/guanylate cyclase domain-containing protein [Verrucomicrobia bacterium]|nr:adenylate/guanylate cyclase domain-containing protein [Verrucomicrobiota bacterium]
MNAILQRNASGEIHHLSAVSIIGRSSECQVVITDPRVSRRHAMVRKQDGGFYLFDLGSFNGSYLNGSRITAARQLRHGDVVSFAEHEFLYTELGEKTPVEAGDSGDATVALIRSTPVVLLVSDIIGYTPLSEAIEAGELAQIIGGWYSECDRILSEAGATVDKFIGDSVLAYWTKVSAKNLHASLRAAEHLLDLCSRICAERPEIFAASGRQFEAGVALHTGKVAYGGMSQGEFTLVGDPVNLTFRLESLTRELGRNVVLSGDFVRKVPELRGVCENHGVRRVKGRDRVVEVFSLNEFPPS